MGVSIYCERLNKSIDLTYMGFQRFRERVSMLACPEWGEEYSKISSASNLSKDEKEEFFDRVDEMTERLIENGKLDKLIVHFCYQADCDGKVSSRACKRIYECIKDYSEDDKITYGYAAHENCPRFKDIKELIKQCSETKSPLTWH